MTIGSILVLNIFNQINVNGTPISEIMSFVSYIKFCRDENDDIIIFFTCISFVLIKCLINCTESVYKKKMFL